MERKFTLNLLKDRLAVCRLAPGSALPEWAEPGEQMGDLWVTIRTSDELTIVCVDQAVPELDDVVRGWRALKVVGPLDFSMIGVLSSLALPLAQAGVSIYALSSYDTDYLLVQEDALPSALSALRTAGHMIEDTSA